MGPERTLTAPSDAAKTAQDGDVIEIEAGVYDSDAVVWIQNNLTIRGIGARAHFHVRGRLAEDKGIWVIKGRNVTIENAEFSGARGPHRNGSGIRGEGVGLTLRDCYFHDNDTGVMAGGGPQSDILVERSEFGANGVDGHSHNIYIVSAKSFTFRASYSHHAMIGHGVKSRAATNYILYSRIMDEVIGTPAMPSISRRGPVVPDRQRASERAPGRKPDDGRVWCRRPSACGEPSLRRQQHHGERLPERPRARPSAAGRRVRTRVGHTSTGEARQQSVCGPWPGLLGTWRAEPQPPVRRAGFGESGALRLPPPGCFARHRRRGKSGFRKRPFTHARRPVPAPGAGGAAANSRRN